MIVAQVKGAAGSGKVKEHCNKCVGHTNHTVLHTEKSRWEDIVDDGRNSISGGDKWELLKCDGCESIRLRHQDWFSEETDADGTPVVNTEFFPPSITRQKPMWRRDLLMFIPNLNEFYDLQDEIYAALAIGAHRIATMGIRALVERIMIDKVGDRGTFTKNIEAFTAEYVAKNQHNLFKKTLIEAGHAAMHRGLNPSAATINTLLDITESVFWAVYYSDGAAAEVKKTIPPRP